MVWRSFLYPRNGKKYANSIMDPDMDPAYHQNVVTNSNWAKYVYNFS